MCVCVGNTPNYVYLNIISTGLYTTFIGVQGPTYVFCFFTHCWLEASLSNSLVTVQ